MRLVTFVIYTISLHDALPISSGDKPATRTAGGALAFVFVYISLNAYLSADRPLTPSLRLGLCAPLHVVCAIPRVWLGAQRAPHQYRCVWHHRDRDERRVFHDIHRAYEHVNLLF